MKKEDLKLCYVESNWAFFTTQKLKDQWGDDWNDAPYEHNAGSPYEYRKDCEHDSKKKPWIIVKVAFDGHLDSPCDFCGSNSPYSVEQINNKVVAWLADRWGNSKVSINAGVSISDFEYLINKSGGKVYKSDD